MPQVIIFRERLLSPSETFIVEQAQALRRYRPVLAGLRRLSPSLVHDIPEELLTQHAGMRGKLAANLYRNLPLGRSFYRRLRQFSPSILHAHFATDAAQALPIAIALRLPLVVSLHGYDVTTTDDAHARTASGRHYLAHRQELLAQTSAFLCVSRFIRETALAAGYPEEKLHLHYTGVDCERFRPARIPRDPNLVLFVGRLVEKKGCEFLLRAMALVQQQHPRAYLEIIGDGPLRTQLEALAQKLDVRTDFRGVQAPAEVQRSMSRARIVCNPSVTASSGDAEGFGMIFAEAQALGTPVVSTLHAAIPEAVSHGVTGLLCPEREPQPLADALLLYLNDDTLWSASSERAVAWVRQHFDLNVQTRKLEAIYDTCLERRQRISTLPRTGHPARPPIPAPILD
jgi:glycosyltransferase involved in cell wall biosynthesis